MGLLTDLDCRRAKPGDELHDGNRLVLRVGAKKETWTLVWRTDGRVRKAALGTYPDMGLAKAREVAQQGMVRARAGFAPVAPPESATPSLRQPPRLTVEGVLRTYVVRHVRPECRDPDQIEWVVDTLLKPLHGHEAAKITRQDVTRFLDDVADKRGGPSAYRAGSVLRAAFRFGLRRGDIEIDPTHLLPLPSPGQARERVLTGTEVGAVWHAQVAVWSRLFRVLLLSGLRLREAAEAPAEELQGDLWVIPAARMKGGREHVVPLHDSLRAELGDLKEARWLFRSPRRFDQPVSGFSRGLELLHRETGTSNWTWHDTRRTVASGLQRLGCPHDVIEAILAHQKSGVSSVYQRHDYVRERRHWLALWAEHCAGLPARIEDVEAR